MDRTIFETRLIEELQQHPNLYTKRSQLDFHDYNTIEQSWSVVAGKLCTDTKTCKKIWRNLRDSYVRQLKKINCCIDAGSDPTHYTKWKHFDKMGFLKAVISHRSLNDSKSLDPSSYICKTEFYDEPRSLHDHNSFIGKIEMLEAHSLSSDSVSDKDIPTQLDPSRDDDASLQLNGASAPDWRPPSLEESGPGEEIVNSFLSKSSSTGSLAFPVSSVVTTTHNNSISSNNNGISKSNRCSQLPNEESFGQHVARSLENLSALRRSLAKVKIQEILSEFEQEDARDPVHFMPNIFLNSSFSKL